MGISEKIKALLALDGKRIIELADHFGISRQSMSNKIARDSWSAADLLKVAEFVNCELSFELPNGQRISLITRNIGR